MNDTLSVEEFPEFAERWLRQNRHAYHADLGEHRLLLFYVTPSTYSIAWPGTVDFSKLLSQILPELSQILRENQNGMDEILSSQGTGALILAESNELLRFSLDSLEEGNRLYDVLSHAFDKVAFARFDSGGALKYSFTAANPKYSVAPELSVRLPRRDIPSSQLLGWIVDHHVDADEVGAHLSLRALRDSLIESLTPPRPRPWAT
jgi:hypothetical protein